MIFTPHFQQYTRTLGEPMRMTKKTNAILTIYKLHAKGKIDVVSR